MASICARTGRVPDPPDQQDLQRQAHTKQRQPQGRCMRSLRIQQHLNIRRQHGQTQRDQPITCPATCGMPQHAKATGHLAQATDDDERPMPGQPCRHDSHVVRDEQEMERARGDEEQREQPAGQFFGS